MNADPTPMNADLQRARLDVISRRTIGCALKVSNTLGFGFLEKVYENALVLELEGAGIAVVQQRPVQVTYKGRVVGDYIPDLLIENEIVVEVKASAGLEKAHYQQCLNYLRATGHHVCLLLNFGRARLEMKRLVWNF